MIVVTMLFFMTTILVVFFMIVGLHFMHMKTIKKRDVILSEMITIIDNHMNNNDTHASKQSFQRYQQSYEQQ